MSGVYVSSVPWYTYFARRQDLNDLYTDVVRQIKSERAGMVSW